MMKNKKIVLGILVLGFLISGIVAYVYWGKYEQEAETGIEWFQTGNNLHQTELQPKQSRDLGDNGIGVEAAAGKNFADWAPSTGLKWARVHLDREGQWQEVDWEKDEYVIDPEEERLINDILSNDIKIMYSLDVWYPELRTVFYKTEEDIEQYINYVRFVVRHFKGRIDYYEILNEPDLSFGSPSGLPLPYYVNLIKQTVPVIREEDPQAKIVVGAIVDTRFNDSRDYMWSLLTSEAMPLVDGISWHGMYGAAPSEDLRGVRQPETPQMENYWENYPSLVKEIKEVSSAAGFKGEYFVEEMRWRTPSEPHETEPYGFSDIASAKYSARAIIIHRGLNVNITLDAHPREGKQQTRLVVQNLCAVMAGAEPVNLPIEIESEATNIKHYGFALPNGDKLLALWTDGVAVDDDTGVEATVTVTGLSGGKVTGIDVLHGFEQELMTTVEHGNLVISNMFIKDYPIILRMSE